MDIRARLPGVFMEMAGAVFNLLPYAVKILSTITFTGEAIISLFRFFHPRIFCGPAADIPSPDSFA
jgi:hypothetical protein